MYPSHLSVTSSSKLSPTFDGAHAAQLEHHAVDEGAAGQDPGAGVKPGPGGKVLVLVLTVVRLDQLDR